MKATELRIGNIVCPDDIMIVTAVRENGLIDLESPTYPEDDYCTKGIEEIPAIPLTEEWLMKFGLTQDRIYKYRYEKGTFIIHKTIFTDIKGGRDGWVLSLDYGQYLRSEIKYVHQLQNLYFALTGEELTIKKDA